MFDIGWTEMLVVVCVAIIVVGPKDLPKVLRGFGKAMKAVRGLAGDFQKQFEEAVKDADMGDVKNIASGKGFQPLEDVKKSVTDFEKDVKAQMEARAKEMDDAMEAEAAGLPEPAAAKADSDKDVSQTAKTLAPTKAEAAAGKNAAGRKPAAKKPAAKKPADGENTPGKAPPKSTSKAKSEGTSTTRKKTATGKTRASASAKSGSSASKPPTTKTPRKTTAKTEKTA